MSGDRSLRQELSGQCPECGAACTVNAWVAIDGDNNPALLELAMADELNVGRCAQCGTEAVIDAPLVIWCQNAIPPLLFVPSMDGGMTDGVEVIERIRDRAVELGSRLTTKRAVLTPRVILRRLFAPSETPASDIDDRASRYFAEQVRQWRAADTTDHDIEALENVTTWGQLAEAVRDRPSITSRATIAELEATRASACDLGNFTLMHRVDGYLGALRECEQFGADQVLGAHSSQEPIGARQRVIMAAQQVDRLGGSDSSAKRVAARRELLGLVDPYEEPAIWRSVALGLAKELADQLDGDRVAHIEDALVLYGRIRESLGAPDADLVMWADVLNNQAIAHRRRLTGSRNEQIDQALVLYEEAATIYEKLGDEAGVAATRANIAAALIARPGAERVADRERAIALLELVVPKLASSPGYQVAFAHLALANAYFARSASGDDARAAASYRDAASAYKAEGSPFQAAMAIISAAGADVEANDAVGATRAVAAIIDALRELPRDKAPREWARGHLVLAQARRKTGDVDGEVLALQVCLEICTPNDFPADCLDAARALGNAYTRQAAGASATGALGVWGRAADAYALGIDAAERLYERGELQRDQELVELADLRHRAALAMARAGRVRDAAMTLETGRARRVTELLRSDDLIVKDSRPEEAGVSGLEAVVYVVVTSAGAEAIILTGPDGGVDGLIESVELDVVYEKFAQLMARRTDAGEARGYLVGQQGGSATLRAALWSALPEIGAAIMSPIANCLRGRGVTRIVLIPTGFLGAFPLHAATYDREGSQRAFFDEFAVSYAPSAAALSVARRRATRADARSPMLVGIAEPLPSVPRLPNAIAELDAVSEYFTDTRRLVGEGATREALLDALPSATHLLLACHGAFDMEDPLSSHITLARGERLEVGELLERRPFVGLRLVVASSCQSAMVSSTSLPDEYVGLASALLVAGAASVLASLWPVYDLSTALLMGAFMKFHRLGDPVLGTGPQSPANALASAQRWLRDVRATDLAAYFEAQLAAPEEGAAPHRLRVASAQTVEAASYFGSLDPEIQPYRDEPITWAGFVLVGAP